MHAAPQPPRFAARLLRRLHPEDTLEEVQGDLEELYADWHRQYGRRRANVRYGLAVLSVLPPFVRRRRPSRDSYPPPAYLQTAMLRNYFLVAWRNLVRQKVSASINVLGLAAGMAVALLNGLWIYDELSFNRYHGNYDRIARVYRQETWNGETGTGTSMQIPLGTELREAYGKEFTHVVTSSWLRKHILTARDKAFSQTGKFMQPEAPEMLTLKMVYGSRAGLNDRHAIMLSETLARKLFGNANPLGEVMQIDQNMEVTVTGVFEDLPGNSEYHKMTFLAPWDLLVSANDYIRGIQDDWSYQEVELLVQIPADGTFAGLEARIRNVLLPHVDAKYAAAKPTLILHPMRKWHLYSKFENGQPVTSEPLKFVRLFAIIAVFVLLLACINFMNLSTARSQKRAREVGVRKTLGSSRGRLVYQFMSESVLIAALAFVLSIALVQLALPWFNGVAGKDIRILWASPWFWLACITFTLFTGVLASSYPALFLSSFKPVQVLKGTLQVGSGAVIPRKVLVVLQFSVSIALITGTIVVYRQIQHTKDRPVGYSLNGLVMVQKANAEFDGKFEVLRTELKNTGVVAEVAEAASPVTGLWYTNGGFDWRGKDPATESNMGTVSITPEYGKTVGWQFVAGRDFISGSASDSAGFVINEAAARYLGMESPVGEIVSWKTEWYRSGNYRILGVVKDVVMDSPYEPIKPTVFFLPGGKNWMHIRLKPGVRMGHALARMESVFKRITPSAPFDYQFADQAFALKFAAEERIGQLAAFFASLAIFISCLGLLGLASFTAEQRTKEIGIRKVLGASTASLWGLLSKDFLYLVGMAFLVAAPLAGYFLSGWLENYSYRTTLSWWIFALAGGTALLLTLLTVSVQAIRTALRNPVKSLRTE